MPTATTSCRPPFAKNQVEMDAEHLGRIQRRMAAEQALPDHCDDRRRDHDLRKARQALLADFTALDAELDQRAHADQTARNHLAVIKVGDGGKSCTLCN